MKTSELAATTSSDAEKFPEKSLKHRLLITMSSDFLRLAVLATSCLCMALVLNQLREQPLPLVYAPKHARIEQAVSQLVDVKPMEVTLPANAINPRIISLAEFQSLVQSKRGVVLDARPEIFHRLGRVPGALSLSREEFQKDYAKLKSLLESRRNEFIAVYCSSASCEDSQMVADALVKLGYQHAVVFKGGWDEWTQAGLAEERR